VTYFDQRHVDRALVVRDHHAREVAVGVTGNRDVHLRMHPFDRLVHHGLKIRAIVGTSSAADRQGGYRKSRQRAAPRSTNPHFRAPFNIVWTRIHPEENPYTREV